MAKVPITVMGYRCERCGHEWVPRGEVDIEPRVCPKCKSPYWDRARKMTYEEFKDKIENVLKSADRPLTWTEVRTRAQLVQMFPKNQWVHRMEQDIKLVRHRDSDNVIQWQLANENVEPEAASSTQSSRTRTSRKKGTME
jgi:predicted Zn-ribbon and HTH transcriptional regulator